MLSRYDAELALRDPLIPSLPLLFDAKAFKRKLKSTMPQLNLTELSVNYVRYKPGTSCMVAGEAKIDDEPTSYYAKGLSLESAHKIDKAHRRINGSSQGVPGLVLNDAPVAVYFFPEDRHLRILSRLVKAQSRKGLLQRNLKSRQDLWDVDLSTLRYKPERRYVAKMITPNGSAALLKVYAGKDYQSSQRGSKIVTSREHLRIADRIGRSNRHKMVILEWLDGELLSEALKDPRFNLANLEHVAAALVELHEQRPPRLREANPTADVKALSSVAAYVAFLCPSLSDKIIPLTEGAISALSETKKHYYSVHNDFSVDQILVENGHIGFIDLDLASRGDRFMDLSSFVANIEYSVLVGDPYAFSAGEISDTFLHAYQEYSGKRLRSNLNRKIAASLIRLAPQPFRYRLSNWPSLTERIIERAYELSRRKFRFGQWLSSTS